MRLTFLQTVAAPAIVALAAVVVAAAPLQDATARVLRVYDVSLLVEPVEDHPGPSLDVDPNHTKATIWGERRASEPQFEADDLVDLIRGSIEPDSWRHEAVRCEVAGTTLHVVQSTAVQTQVQSFLARLRRDVGTVVEADVAVWRATAAQARALTAGAPGRAGVYPTGGASKALKAMEGAEQLDRVTVVLRSGQRAHASALRKRPYVGEIEVEVAEKSEVGDPITFTHVLGLVADLKAIPNGDGSRVWLESRLGWAEMADVTRVADTELGNLELPERRVTNIRGLAELAFGEQWCGAASADGGKSVVFVLSARRRAGSAAGGAKDPDGGRRVSRVYSIASLTYEAYQFPAPNLASRLNGAGVQAAAGMVFSDDAAGEAVRLDPEAVAELIRGNLDPDSWEHPRNVLQVRGQSLLITHTPAVQKQVAAMLASLEGSRPPALRIEAVLVQPDAALDGLVEGRNGSTIADDAVAGWLATAGRRIEAYGSVTAQNGQRVYAALQHTVPAIGDWDAEVASSAAAKDPVVRTALEGFVLDAQALLSGDAKTVSLRLEPERAFVARPIRTVETAHGPVALLEPSRHVAGLTPVVSEGEWTAQRFGRNAQGKPLVLLTSVRRTR